MKLWASKHLSKWTRWSMRAKMGCDPYSLKAIKSKLLGILIWSLGIFHCSHRGTCRAILSKIWAGAYGGNGWVGMEWSIKFHCSCATCKHRFFSEIFCRYSFSPKKNKFNPVPVQFSKLPNKDHPNGHPRHPEIHCHFLTFFWVLASGPPSAKLCPPWFKPLVTPLPVT